LRFRVESLGSDFKGSPHGQAMEQESFEHLGAWVKEARQLQRQRDDTRTAAHNAPENCYKNTMREVGVTHRGFGVAENNPGELAT
jgi:hypothetical protein